MKALKIHYNQLNLIHTDKNEVKQINVQKGRV